MLRQLQVTFALKTSACNLAFTLDDAEEVQRDILHSLSSSKFYEHETSLLMQRVLGEGDVAIDVGANVGYFTLLMGRFVGPSGHVFAIEPNPRHTQPIRNHINVNGVAATLLPVALGHKTGTAEFRDNSEQNGNGGFALPTDGPDHRQRYFTVEVATLDRLAEQNPLLATAKLIKLDIEGAESLALAGATEFLKRDTLEIVICEANSHQLEASTGGSFDDIRALMATCGFDCFLMSHRGDLPTQVPPEVHIAFPYVTNVAFIRHRVLAKYWPEVVYLPAAAMAAS